MKPPVGEWAEQGACRGEDPELFHPERGANETADEAKRVCARCLVRAECLAYAVSKPFEQLGVWGGMSSRERERHRGFQVGDPLPAVALRVRGASPVRSVPVKIGRPRQPIVHGTTAGYAAHRRRGEPTCDACKAAHSESQKSKPYYLARHADRAAS